MYGRDRGEERPTMKHRELEALIHMAFEVERLDALVAPAVRRRSRVGTRSLRISSLAVGLAAALLVFALSRGPVVAPVKPKLIAAKPVDAKTRPEEVSVCHLPAMDDSPTRVETFEPRVAEPATLVAILRTWSEDCDCLAWRLHEWRDGSLLHDVAPGETLSIELASADQPSIQQVLLIAVAKNRGTLANVTQNEASELLDCLNSRQLATGPDIEPATYASSVAACLPPDVMVIPQTYVARK